MPSGAPGSRRPACIWTIPNGEVTGSVASNERSPAGERKSGTIGPRIGPIEREQAPVTGVVAVVGANRRKPNEDGAPPATVTVTPSPGAGHPVPVSVGGRPPVPAQPEPCGSHLPPPSSNEVTKPSVKPERVVSNAPAVSGKCGEPVSPTHATLPPGPAATPYAPFTLVSRPPR